MNIINRMNGKNGIWLDKNIKRKGVKIPGFWLVNRKKILGIDFEIT